MSEIGMNDHDLLIELRTEMRGLRADLKALSDGISTRVTNLENTKLDKLDFERESLRLLVQSETKAREIFLTKSDGDKDHETRLRSVETSVTRILTWGSVGVVLLGVAQFLLNRFV